MANPLLLPEIRAMIAEGDEQGLTAVMNEMHPASVADFAEGLSIEETWKLLDHAPISSQADVFAFFPLDKQEELVSGVGRERMSKLLEAMSHDDRVDLLKRLDDEVVENLLPLVTKADRQDMRRLLSYPEDSAGSVMTTDYASLPAEITVGEAIQRLRQEAPHRETIYYVYVLDEARHLIGFISLRNLILAKPTAKIADIMQRDVISVRVDQDQEEVAQTLAKYDFIAMPVVLMMLLPSGRKTAISAFVS
jgi:magnesium transporter